MQGRHPRWLQSSASRIRITPRLKVRRNSSARPAPRRDLALSGAGSSCGARHYRAVRWGDLSEEHRGLTRCALMLPFAPAAVAPVRVVSPAYRPCKRYAIPAPYPLRTSAPSNVPKVAIAGSLPTAAPGVRVSASSSLLPFDSLSGAFSVSVSPAPARGSTAGILVHPGTGAGVRSPIPSGSAPEPTIPLGPR